MTLKEVREPIYCTCKNRCNEGEKAYLINRYCPCCNKKIKVTIKFDITRDVEIKKTRIPKVLIEALLVNLVNKVIINDVTHEVDEDCLSIKGVKDAYPLDYMNNKIRYNIPTGHPFNNPRLRPYKTGTVKGYFNKYHKFVIVKQ